MGTFCRTTMNYASGSAPGGEALRSLVPVEVDVLDGRAASLPGWRECGFELVSGPGARSAVDDWHDDDVIAAVHYPEVEELARTLTGCSHALVSDHVKRTAEASKRPREQSPVRLVHSDFAPGYDEIVRTAYHDVKGRGAATLARSGLSASEIEGARRIVMMQFWRNLGPATMDTPVAFCDARTVTPAEGRPFRYTGYVAGGRSFDALAIAAPADGASPAHGWYVFPDLRVDEVVAFRTYDTDLVAAGATYFTPHSAFRDPRVADGGPARFSIELRVLCLDV